MIKIILETKNEEIIQEFIQYLFETYSIKAEKNFQGILMSELDKLTQVSLDKAILINVNELSKKFNVKMTLKKPLSQPLGFHKLNLNEYSDVITNTLESKAKEYQYDNIVSACSYSNSTIEQYKKESIAFIAWRDYLWSVSLQEAKIALDNIPISINEFIDSLPTYESFLI
jgi:hypothetical protein